MEKIQKSEGTVAKPLNQSKMNNNEDQEYFSQYQKRSRSRESRNQNKSSNNQDLDQDSNSRYHQQMKKENIKDDQKQIEKILEKKRSRFSSKPSVPEAQQSYFNQALNVQASSANEHNQIVKINKYQEKIMDVLGQDSTKPLGLEQLQKAAEQAENADISLDPFFTVTADKDYIYFPGMPPKKRKNQNKWRNATEEEINNQLNGKGFEIENENFFEEFMKRADPELMKNLNPTILNSLQDVTKIKKKMYIPKNPGVNYIGLIIGPGGHYQKRLEEESECKILIRGKGSQKQGSAPQPDDEDDQHVLVIGETIQNVQKACQFVERILNSDDITREKIRKEQLQVAALLQEQKAQIALHSNYSQAHKYQGQTIQDIYRQVGIDNKEIDDTMMTPYGPPSALAYIIPIPNDCVGLIIGKNGETIKQLQLDSGAKVQVAKKEVEETGMRNVFVEGPDEKFQKAKEMIEEIVRNQQMMNSNNPFANRQSNYINSNSSQIAVGDQNPFITHQNMKNVYKFEIPDKMVGLVIGKGSETLKGIALRSNTKIFIPQKNPAYNLPQNGSYYNQPDQNSLTRQIEVIGSEIEQQIAKDLIFELIEGQNDSQNRMQKYNSGYQSNSYNQAPYFQKKDSYYDQQSHFGNNYNKQSQYVQQSPKSQGMGEQYQKPYQKSYQYIQSEQKASYYGDQYGQDQGYQKQEWNPQKYNQGYQQINSPTNNSQVSQFQPYQAQAYYAPQQTGYSGIQKPMGQQNTNSRYGFQANNKQVPPTIINNEEASRAAAAFLQQINQQNYQ